MDLQTVKTWLNHIFPNGTFKDFKVTIDGQGEKGEGYVGDILFVSATSPTKTYNLAIKHGKPSRELRNTLPVRDAFLNEIAVYESVFPEFNEFQQSKNVGDIFTSYPKCYGTIVADNMEVIVLENAKKSGYELHDRQQSMNLEHMKLVLEEYGKFHAISLAMKDQQLDKFAKLTSKLNRKLVEDFGKNGIMDTFVAAIRESLPLFEGNSLIGQRLESLMGDIQALIEKPHDCGSPGMVISHGDCWNNNFMFKYDQDKTKPTKVVFLDWQISKIDSPAFDLSYFIYATASKEQLDHFDELLQTYHDSISRTLKRLGSDVEKVFPFSLLMEHWKKYARIGVAFCPTIVKICFCPKEKAPDMAAGIEAGVELSDLFKVDVEHKKDDYNRRIKDVVLHAFERGFL